MQNDVFQLLYLVIKNLFSGKVNLISKSVLSMNSCVWGVRGFCSISLPCLVDFVFNDYQPVCQHRFSCCGDFTVPFLTRAKIGNRWKETLTTNRNHNIILCERFILLECPWNNFSSHHSVDQCVWSANGVQGMLRRKICFFFKMSYTPGP